MEITAERLCKIRKCLEFNVLRRLQVERDMRLYDAGIGRGGASHGH